MEGNANDNKEKNTISPMTQVIADIKDRGYTKEFIVKDGKLKEMGTDNTYEAKDLHLTNEYRFEGTSDPEYMGILYTVESKQGGDRGYLTSAYGGPYSDTEVNDFVKKIERHDGRDLNKNMKL
jgi:hypothetical protein